MSIERNLIITILKLTKDGPVSHELINKDANIPSQVAQKLLRKLQEDGLIYLKRDVVEADNIQRLKLTIKAINLGADLENASSFLQWQEFENMAAVALTRNNYIVEKNLRFKHAGRKWEIDIVGCKKPIALCIDCKHWHHGMYPSALKKIVEEQLERISALTEALPNLADKIECASWDRIKLVPAVLSLIAGRFRFYNNVPIVPVLQLQDFLNQLPAYADSLKFLP
jgi:Holliday junction resolvase-like predicted endonuclease/predicted transcriptional regulator